VEQVVESRGLCLVEHLHGGLHRKELLWRLDEFLIPLLVTT
jgi:hypothetical protein